MRRDRPGVASVVSLDQVLLTGAFVVANRQPSASFISRICRVAQTSSRPAIALRRRAEELTSPKPSFARTTRCRQSQNDVALSGELLRTVDCRRRPSRRRRRHRGRQLRGRSGASPPLRGRSGQALRDVGGDRLRELRQARQCAERDFARELAERSFVHPSAGGRRCRLDGDTRLRPRGPRRTNERKPRSGYPGLAHRRRAAHARLSERSRS